MAETVLPPFDINSLTLGEGLAVEKASGLDIRELEVTRQVATTQRADR